MGAGGGGRRCRGNFAAQQPRKICARAPPRHRQAVSACSLRLLCIGLSQACTSKKKKTTSCASMSKGTIWVLGHNLCCAACSATNCACAACLATNCACAACLATTCAVQPARPQTVHVQPAWPQTAHVHPARLHSVRVRGAKREPCWPQTMLSLTLSLPEMALPTLPSPRTLPRNSATPQPQWTRPTLQQTPQTPSDSTVGRALPQRCVQSGTPTS
jgi:hypothetical protein